MIYTSYFANLKNIPNTITPIAICGKTPQFYNGLTYKKLAPKYSFFSVWKQTHDNDYYIQQFQNLVLDDLNADDVVKELESLSKTKDFVLVCYEKPTDFCHRHLVAKWLYENGYDCMEFRNHTQYIRDCQILKPKQEVNVMPEKIEVWRCEKCGEKFSSEQRCITHEKKRR